MHVYFILYYFVTFFSISIDFGLCGIWEVFPHSIHNTILTRNWQLMRNENPVIRCVGLKRVQEDEYYPLSYTGNIFLIHSL